MNRTVKWGILGTGDIARQMADDLRLVPHAELRAVASRTRERADLFGDTHDIPVRHASYGALAEDPEIDVVYVATPHPHHCENSLLCMTHGKGVLCEKPLAMNRGEVDRMIAAAESRGTFLMEAFWTAFFPAMEALRADLARGAIGEPRLVMANFSYHAKADPNSRLFNPSLGGGALLDIGIYAVALADMVFGVEPQSIHSSWTPAPTGVDESSALILDFGEGRRAMLNTSLACDAPQEATIVGDRGTIQIPHRFSQPDTYRISVGGHTSEHTFARMGYGYHLEARSVTRCVQGGHLDCPTVPWSMSQRVIRTLDRIRAPWGLHYPMEAGIS